MQTMTATYQVPMQRGFWSNRFDTRMPALLEGKVEEERYEITVGQLNTYFTPSRSYNMAMFSLLVASLLSLTFTIFFALRVGHPDPTGNDQNLNLMFICEGASILVSLVVTVLAFVRLRKVRTQIDNFLASENITYYHHAGVDLTLVRRWFRTWVLQIQVSNKSQSTGFTQPAMVQQQQQHQVPMMMAMPMGDASSNSFPMAVFAPATVNPYSALPTQQHQQPAYYFVPAGHAQSLQQ
jgi:hypothetical protein